MKANSNNHPGTFTESRENLQYNYNIIQSEVTDEQGTRTVFNYDYVEVKSKSKTDIIKAVMRNKYSLEDEIALINNKLGGKAKHLIEYDAYTAVRDSVKTLEIKPITLKEQTTK